MDSVILVVDDDAANLMTAQKILGKEFRIAAVNSGKAVFRYLERQTPDLILLDINMPEMDGFEVIRQLKADEVHGQIPVIFLTADKNSDTEIRCFQEGAEDFVNKPFIPEVLLSRVNRILELSSYHNNLENMVKEQAEIIASRERRLAEVQDHLVIGMANLIESRDGNTGEHVKRTQMIVKQFIEELRKSDKYNGLLDDDYVQRICKAVPLHDVGKIKISDTILQKPGSLTDEEYALMKRHAEYGEDIICDILCDVDDEKYIELAKNVVRHHHERWDGKGYPDGIAGEEIPFAARVMALADVFDALYAERCYKSPIRPVEKVLSIIKEERGKQFDPDLTDAFVEMGDRFVWIFEDKQGV